LEATSKEGRLGRVNGRDVILGRVRGGEICRSTSERESKISMKTKKAVLKTSAFPDD